MTTASGGVTCHRVFKNPKPTKPLDKSSSALHGETTCLLLGGDVPGQLCKWYRHPWLQGDFLNTSHTRDG